MKKRRKESQIEVEKPKFIIFQFEKLKGIRGGIVYKKAKFISPIFGTSVKDVVSVPFSIKNTGDTTKRFDVFRTKSKLSGSEAKEKYGTKYYEFTNIVSNKTRTGVFGESDYVPVNDEQIKEIIERKIIKPIMKNSNYINTKPSEPKRNTRSNGVVQVKPIESEVIVEKEPSFITYPSHEKIKPNSIVSSEFGGNEENYEPKMSMPNQTKHYQFPSLSIFSKKQRDLDEKPQWLLDQIDIINATLQQFGIEGSVRGSKKGPTVTRYEIALQPGVNVKRVVSIHDNLMMNLAATSLRVEAPIPGKPYVGLEVPNVEPEIVAFGNVVDTKDFLSDKEHPLKVALGVDIDGENIYADIQAMPHGLIAGATNSGKSVCVNAILVSLLLKNSPEKLRMILIDPKMVELAAYNDLPHLITPVITDAKTASSSLNWTVNEMELRYKKFAGSRTRDIKSYNDSIRRGLIDESKMPYIVIVIDELADLMMAAPQDVEDSIRRLTQKARAAGIHLLVATQRPTIDVIKGTIKSNIPVRIAFKVAAVVDSMTILDGPGAESLLGKGDMLFKRSGRAHRLQGAYIPDDEIYAVTDFIRSQREPNYVFKHQDLVQQMKKNEIVRDEIFEKVAYFVVQSKNASINSIQKEFGVGFNRAQKLVEMLEHYKIVSQSEGTKAREVLVSTYDLQNIIGNE